MAKFDYLKTRNTASALLEKFGGPLTFEKPDASTFNGVGVKIQVTDDNRPDTLTGRNVWKLLLKYESGNLPETGDYVTMDGNTWAVMQVDPLEPDGMTGIFYTCYVSR